MTTGPGNTWGADVLISMPVPSKYPLLVDMGIFGLTEFGLDHNISSADIEDFLPTYGPENDGG
jgi:hypothetical protein